FVSIARFLFIITIIIFLLSQYGSYRKYPDIKWQAGAIFLQRVMLIVMHFLGHLILFMYYGNQKEHLIGYIIQVLFLLLTWVIIFIILGDSHIGLWHLVQMLAIISIIMISRLNYDSGVRQAKVIAVGFILSFFIAVCMRYLRFLSKLTYLYFVFGIGILLMANISLNGANNWFSYGGVSFQPSEIVKLVYLMFIAAFFAKPINHRRLVISGILTVVFLGILVYQNDLGGAFIFYLTYISIAYLASNKLKYFITGLLGGAAGAVIGYMLFSHVRIRVTAWLHPFAYIDDQGFQITQSLFAINSGGWFGQGLTNGLPYKVPVVISDFIYAGIAEEFGNIFAITILLLFILLFLTICKIAFPIKNLFDTILVFGIGLILAIQTFLIVGGVIKMIPSTGVTLPLISYGGTSVMVTLAMIGVVQGLGAKYQHPKEQIDDEDTEYDNEEDYDGEKN
ncbi:MAG: FtsW/RodA/SpoVE family cell cycle protein, partial [Vallitaleaceae bacterium]|nr:FtsW/RodA/SpoVE family cell cycle protein [Vallitaleaceae bacterium]